MKMTNNLCDINLYEWKNEIPLNFYPRPSFERSHLDGEYLNLNGLWDLCVVKDFDYSLMDKYVFNEQIMVPYCYESVLSLQNKLLNKGEYLVYKKRFIFKALHEVNILHIDAVDQECSIYLNGRLVEQNLVGGYLPLDIDISDYLNEENELIIVVKDDLNSDYPYGKQTNKPGGIWYTKVSGIWKTVWIESLKSNFLSNVIVKADIDKKEVTFYFDEDSLDLKNVNIFFKGVKVSSFSTENQIYTLKIEDMSVWTPEEPNIYEFEVLYDGGNIKSYFACRKLSFVEHNGFKVLGLNNKPYFMHGLLDQGYYPEGIYTPKSLESMEHDLKFVKEYGFNTLRKHIKVEDDVWYTLCDKLGIIVWQDFVNNLPYSFFFDSVLPTIGLKKKKYHLKKYKKEAKEFFINHSLSMIDYLDRHPCICYWTIFNEGWGQFDTENVHDIIEKYDNSRFIDDNSGWFNESKKQMLDSRHVYFKPIEIKKNIGKPLIISEFGGYSLYLEGHTYSNTQFGYKKMNDIEDFNKQLLELYENDIVGNMDKGLCASIYTQLTDVEEEVNGLMTYDRKVIKIKKEIAVEISKKLRF